MTPQFKYEQRIEMRFQSLKTRKFHKKLSFCHSYEYQGFVKEQRLLKVQIAEHAYRIRSSRPRFPARNYIKPKLCFTVLALKFEVVFATTAIIKKRKATCCACERDSRSFKSSKNSIYWIKRDENVSVIMAN